MNESVKAAFHIGGISLPDYLLDGYFIHRSALERGMNILALPRQVLLASDRQREPGEVAFTHAVPLSSSLSAVTFAQDRRLRRALFERMNVPKPRGASFSHLGLKNASAWVKRFGYPVTVKEAIGENDGRAIRNVASDAELDVAFHTLRQRGEADRAPGSNPYISGYTTTRLSFRVDDEGNQLAPAKTRMLLERQSKGVTIRGFVVGGRIIAAVELDESLDEGSADVTDALTPEQESALLGAANAIPGLGSATVDVVQRRRRFLRRRKLRPLVTELSERPRMGAFYALNAGLADRIAGALLDAEARNADVRLEPAAATIERDVVIEGVGRADEVGEQLRSTFAASDVEFDMQHIDEVEGRLRARCSGSPATVAAVLELLMAGELMDDRASAVEYTKGESVA